MSGENDQIKSWSKVNIFMLFSEELGLACGHVWHLNYCDLEIVFGVYFKMWYAALLRFIRRRLVLGIIFASSLTYCIVSLLREVEIPYIKKINLILISNFP